MTGSGDNPNGGGWLIVEDEGLVAMLIEDAIAELGLVALGSANRVKSALRLLKSHNPQGALLDLNLGGEPVYPVAEALAARNIPFAFITGYGRSGVIPAYADRPLLQKPFMTAQIQSVVRKLMEQARAAPVS